MDKWYYLTTADSVLDVIQNGIQLHFISVCSEQDLPNLFRKIASVSMMPAIFEIRDSMVDEDEINKNSHVRPEFLVLSSPKDLGIIHKTAERFYDVFSSSCYKLLDTVEKVSGSLILKGSSDLATVLSTITGTTFDNNFEQRYAENLGRANKLNIKNAESAAFMTTIKKSKKVQNAS